MSEQRALLLETAARVFADCSGDSAADGKRIAEAGLIALLVPESRGGFGGDWEDAGAVARLTGLHAVDYPVMEEILKAHLATLNTAWSEARIFRVSAAMRAAQMAGALDAALALSVGYTRERKQFGKPLAAFQAIQQQLAVLTEEAAAANMAAAAAFRALDRGEASFECACAKLRANIAAGIGAPIAHQVHGAMGFTKEYALQKFTKPLWAWRSEFGNDRHWAGELGLRIAARGPENFWSDLVALSDPVQS
jgi:acyl-CoA dehydrogenase